MLANRRTKLKFNDFISDYIPIDNGIGQGCPLSMILYILYNADLIGIPSKTGEDSSGYIDNATLLAIAYTFAETVRMIKDMMTRPGGGLEWARNHNSNFEMLKAALMHFSNRLCLCNADKGGLLCDHVPRLKLEGMYITVVNTYRYLGVLMDPDLNWKAQEIAAISKAQKWVLLFKRLA